MLKNLARLFASLLPFIFIIILIIIFFGKTLTGSQIFATPDFGTSDILYNEFAAKFFLSESVKTGQLPLWNPKIATGFPQMGTIGSFNPISLILFKFLPAHIAFNLGLATIFLTTAIFTYLFSRALLLSKISSLFAAVSFAFSGFFVTQIVHFNVIQTLSFFPAELYLAEMYFQKRKVIFPILLALTVGFQILSGFYQLVLYSLIVLALYILWRIVFLQDSRKNKVLLLVFLLLAILAGFAVGAIQLLPSFEFTQISTREGGVSKQAVKLFPYPVKHLITFIWPYLLGDPRNGTYPKFDQNWGIFWESTGFMGVLPLVFAFFGILFGIRNNLVKFFSLLAVLSLLLMLGKNSPTFFVFQFPPLSLFRVPARWIVFFSFSLAILTGAGLEILRRLLATKTKFEVIISFLVLIAVIVNIFLFAQNYHLRDNSKKWLTPPPTVEFLKKDQSVYRIFTLGNAIVWNEQFTKKGWAGAEDKFFTFSQGLEPHWNVVFDLDHSSSNATILSKRDAALRDIFNKNIGEKGQFVFKDAYFINPVARKILDLQNVKYVISPFNIVGRDLTLVFTSQTQPKFNIYENKTVLPRAFIASQPILARTAQEQYQILASKFFNPRSTVVVEKKLAQTSFNPGNSQAEITKYNNQNVEIAAKMEGDGILVLTDSYYPGWKAFVDGAETEILPANVNQRALVLEKGDHNIKFIFQPKSFKVGAIISIVTSALLLTLLLFLIAKSSPIKI